MSADLLADLDSFYQSQQSQTDRQQLKASSNTSIQDLNNVTNELNISKIQNDHVINNSGIESRLQSSKNAQSNDYDVPATALSITVDEDEDFGEFESAETLKNETAFSGSRNEQNETSQYADLTLKIPSSKSASRDVDNHASWQRTSQQLVTRDTTQEEEWKPKNLDVLFDAEELEFDHENGNATNVDEFGDFESKPPAKHLETSISKNNQDQNDDILSLIDFDTKDTNDTSAGSSSVVTNTHSDSFRLENSISKPVETSRYRENSDSSSEAPTLSRGDTDPWNRINSGRLRSDGEVMPQQIQILHEQTQGSTPARTATSSASQSSVQRRRKPRTPQKRVAQLEEVFDTWDDFEGTIPGSESQTAFKSSENPLKSTPHSEYQRADDHLSDHGNEGIIRLPQLLSLDETPTSSAAPTNIPPPALLISLFPQIMNMVKDELLRPLATHANNPEVRDKILLQHVTLLFLESYLTIATVLSRIISGRKLRWKRDIILSQSMRMGPASSGRSSGMKLTTIDKSEDAKEEREVTEILRLWHGQIGRLRSAIKGTGHNFTVPEVSEKAPIKLVPESEGGIASRKVCALCGLKRNERVLKVDTTQNIQDNFGEFWIEHWGHKACFQFWNFYRVRLQNR